MSRFTPLAAGLAAVSVVALSGCDAPASSSDALGSPPPGSSALPPSGTPGLLPPGCPAPTNDVTLDMELGVPLLYPELKLFNVFWGEHWDDNPANFKRADVDQALRDVVATPYFDRLCQYGVPQPSFEGSSDTDGLIYPCSRSPGATTSTPAIFGYMSCAEYSTIATGVPLAIGAPNPSCIACSGLPVDCANPVTLPAEPFCLATPNPTGNRVYVVLLPKGTIIDDFGSRSCTNYGAYHFQIPSRAVFQPLPPFVIPGTQGRPLNLAVIPTECYTTLADLVAAITHEVVEAATDPLPLAHWIDGSSASPGGVFDITHIGSLFTEGEAADICQNQGFTQTAFTGSTGLALGVAPYWSNADNSCVSIDATPPVTVASVAPPPTLSGWNAGDVTVTLTATDPGTPASGVKELVHAATGAQPIPATVVPGAMDAVTFTVEGTSHLAFHAVDQAGNVEAEHGLDVRIDRTAPVVAWAGNAGTYAADATVALTCTATDALSGVATTTCADVSAPAWTFGPGPHTVTASATDRAGNTASASATFTVSATATSLCHLAQELSSEPRTADRLCCLLARIDRARCCRQQAHAVEMAREELCEESGDAFTVAEAAALDAFVATLAPATCTEKPRPDGSDEHGDDAQAGDDHDSCGRARGQGFTALASGQGEGHRDRCQPGHE
ncbi:MAG: hypothetical protein U0229_23690 [Anaeromyxobacter sp.]